MSLETVERSLENVNRTNNGVAYLDSGVGEDIAILVHGSFFTAATWRRYMTTLAEANIRTIALDLAGHCLLYTSPSPRDATLSRMPSSA